MAAVQGTETLMAKHRTESLARTERLMEYFRLSGPVPER
jgi:hypothetical protein